MAQKTIELEVARGREMGVDGNPSLSPIAPFDIAEPDMNTEHMLINIGPQHPATHGVLRLVCELDGETVKSVVPDIGYLHSSFEKLGEYRSWNQIVTLTDRMDYLAPLIYNCAYVMSVEKLMGIEVTERCKVVRVILMEMDRIFGHLLWLGTTAIDVGAFTPFLYSFQERERIYKLHESLTGARITTSATRVGGMMADLPEGWTEALGEFLDTFPDTLAEVHQLLTRNQIHIGRTQGIGAINGADAINYGFTGPNLRAAGVDYDVRRDRPYYDYETYDFEVPVGQHGDCYDRYLVRMEEMRQSVRLLDQCLAKLPGGPVNVDDGKIILPDKQKVLSSMEELIHQFMLVTQGQDAPAGEVYFGAENPKGELGFYIFSKGGGVPYRLKIRAPSFANLSILSHTLPGHMISDVVAILGSLDFVMGECDR